HAKERGVEIFGDMPIYVSSDSVEMWKYGKILFETDGNGRQTLKAGVPPDAFSSDGQLWGNPVYRWQDMKKDGYAWWRERIEKAFELLDIVRIDHFRAFDRYYVVEAGATTAREGRWEEGPKEELFAGMLDLPVVAEDLGVIDEGVLRLMKNAGYPGMRVLQFAFDGGADNTNKPSNSPENSVTYTGTHDNAPFKAYAESLSGWERERFEYDFKRECEKFGFASSARTPEEYCADAVRLAFASPSFLCVVPVQDLLALGSEARINAPSTLSDLNWSYRFSSGDLFSGETKERLRALIEEYGRGGE
ncbi:MAG: 4-alpha-glucanotransferase, partial [Candidatus Scatosoma sp.]